jgi:hypothetical protein
MERIASGPVMLSPEDKQALIRLAHLERSEALRDAVLALFRYLLGSQARPPKQKPFGTLRPAA